MHLIYGALPVPYVPAVRVKRGALVAYRYIYMSLLAADRTTGLLFPSQYISLWNDLADPVDDGMGLLVLRARPMFFYWPNCSLPFCLLLFSLSLIISIGWYCGTGVFGLIR